MGTGPVIHRARWIVPVAAEPLQDAEVVVENGIILEVRLASRGPATDHGDAAILPAFVNAHCHLEYTGLAGMATERRFVPWLRQVSELKRSVEPQCFADGARHGARMNALAGTGTIGDFSDAPVSAQAMTEAGLRGVVFQEVIAARHQPTWQESLEACRHKAACQRDVAGPGVVVHLAPHATYSVVEDALRTFGDGPTAIHCAESRQEVEFLQQGRGELAEWFREVGLAVRPPYAAPVTYLHSLGLLRPDVQLVHCVQLSSDDIRAIAEAGCSVVHCPRSNARLGVGSAPVHELMEAGVNVALGTDSLLSNDDFDMFEEMRAAQRVNCARGRPAIPARTLLRMATHNGAVSLGLGGVCGSLQPGLAADLLVVSLRRITVTVVGSIEAAIVAAALTTDIAALLVANQPLAV